MEESKTASNASEKVDASSVDSRLEAETNIEITEIEYPTKFKLVMVVVALVLSMFLASLDMITSDFNSLEDIGWYASSFFVTIASFQACWGKAYKYFPLKTVFLIGIGIFEVGSLICGVAPNSVALIVGRAITGVGAGGLIGGCYTIIAFSVPPVKRPAFTGILGATYGVSSVIGPLLGGIFTERVSWRWCFYINLPIGGVSAAIILFFFKTPEGAIKANNTTLREKILQMDFPGASLIMAAVICYVLALEKAGVKKSWNSSMVIGLLVGFVVFIIAFVIVEYYQKDRALLEPRLIKDRTMIVSCAFVALLGGSFFVLLYYLPLYFQSVQGVTASQSGIRNLPLIISMTLFIILSGGLLTMYGRFAPLFLLGGIITSIGTGLIYTLSLTSPSSQWIGYQILAGSGIGLCFQVPVMVGQALASADDVAVVTAILMFIQTIGGALLVSAAQSAFINTLLSSLSVSAPTIDPFAVLSAGATGLRDHFSAEELPGILEAYVAALRVAFGISIASGGLAAVVAVFAPWSLEGSGSIKKRGKKDVGGKEGGGVAA